MTIKVPFNEDVNEDEVIASLLPDQLLCTCNVIQQYRVFRLVYRASSSAARVIARAISAT
jgi:hypothetical protein